MYTVDDKKEYEEEEEEIIEESFWQRNRSLIFKILIILVCIIILILLIKALKKNNNVVTYDENTHNANVLKVRLAAEEYFFINNNIQKDKINEVTLDTLYRNKLLEEVVDGDHKTCHTTKSYVTLAEDGNLYAMKIKLNCSTEEKEEVFYYSTQNMACLNCNGKTLMTGILPDKKDDDTKTDEKTIDYGKYSCNAWSSWTTERINDDMLTERTRTLVKGVKLGGYKENVVYGEWSNWTETPITATSTLEVEQKAVNEQRWSDNKTSTSTITESATVKIVSTEKVSGTTVSTCPSGYKKSGSKCVSTKLYKGDLTYTQYNSGKYEVTNKPCASLNTEKDANGKYVWVYKSCQYRKVTSTKKTTSKGYTIYTYQELETIPVTYYRSRTKTIEKVKIDDVYTIDYYEEKNLPSGYTKVSGSEKVEYSYKLSSCEK